MPVLALVLTGSDIGIVTQAFRDFPALVKGKTIVDTADDQSTYPRTHMQAAEAAMCIHEGALVLYRCAERSTPRPREGGARPAHSGAHGLDPLKACGAALTAWRSCSTRVARPASDSRACDPAVADLRVMNQHGLLNLEMNRERLRARAARARAEHSPDLNLQAPARIAASICSTSLGDGGVSFGTRNPHVQRLASGSTSHAGQQRVVDPDLIEVGEVLERSSRPGSAGTRSS